jgi:Asp/Glu/hydantoin racemase
MTQDARIWYQSSTDPDVDAPYFTRLREYLRSIASPGYEVHAFGLQPGARFLHPITEFRFAAQVIAGALTAQREGYDAFVIGNFQDAGLRESRAAVEIPVIGLGEASMLHACTLGRKIALVTINPMLIPDMEQQIAQNGLERRVVAVRAIEGRVDRLNKAFTDRHEYERVRGEFAAQMKPLLELGVDVIILAGGYPMLLFAHEAGFHVEGATVLNGLPVTIAAAETAIRLTRLNGTGTSRRPTYALPPREAIAEFERVLGEPASGVGSRARAE